MAALNKYTINWTDSTLKSAFTLDVKATDTEHSSLTLIGGGTMEWGAEYQENLVHLLENFASNAKPPENPTIGQLWFNTADNFLKVYTPDGDWRDLKNKNIGSITAPVGQFYPGDLWYDQSRNQLKVYLNEGVWSDPMSGSLPTPRPIPVPAPSRVSPTPSPAIGTPAPVTPTPTPVTPTPSPVTYTIPAHTIAYYGPEYVWGLDGTDGTSRVILPVPSLLQQAYPQLTISNEGVKGNTISKLLTGTDGVHRDWDFEMSQSTNKVVFIASFGYAEQSMTEQQWTDALTQAVQTALNYGKLVVLVTMHTIDSTVGGLGQFSTIMKNVALQLSVGFIEIEQYTATQFTGNIRDWLPDGITPNQKGYNVIAQGVISQYPLVYKKLTSVDTSPGSQLKPFGQDASLYPSLTFAEEFNGSSFNSSIWSLGMWYDSPNNLNNYSLSNGALTVWAAQDQSGAWTPHNFTITTDGTFYQKYGYFEIEAKLPYGSGVYPSFWLCSHLDSTRPEIDVMQAWPSDVADSFGNSSFHPINYRATVTSPNLDIISTRDLIGSVYNNVATAPDLSAGFHKYGVRWDSSGIQFFFDGQPLGTKIIANYMTYKMFFVIDLWVGSKAATPDSTIPSTVDRGMVINYLRAWALNDGSTQVSGTAVGTAIPAPTPVPASPAPVVTTIQPYGQSGTYSLTFSDEFNEGSLDLTTWNDHIWYETSDPVINYSVENGDLLIWPSTGFVNRTVDTDTKFEQLYGYFEIEAKLPIGKGCWPAFWLFRHDDSAGSKARLEIDVMEAYPGGGPSSGWSDANFHPTNYGTALHVANIDYTQHLIPYSRKLTDSLSPVDLSAGFHKYAVKWESNGITFYFDGQPLGPKWMDTDQTFDQPMYVILDLWFGSTSGNPDATTPTGKTNSFDIRYARAWSFGQAPTPTPTPTVTPTPVVPVPTVTPPTPATQQFHVGMHAHRLYNNGGDENSPSPEPQFNYGLIRDWNIEKIFDYEVWLPDGSINVSLVQQVYDGHAKHGARVVKCFGTVPQWAAKRPNEANPFYPNFPGALSGPADLNVYEDYCYRFISTFRSYLYAVEGWNEPYGSNTNPTDSTADNPQYTTMTATELADVQKRLYTAAKRVDPNLLVFSPGQSYLETIPQLLQATTSQGEPIYNFFDVLAWHGYNYSAGGVAGPDYATECGVIRGYLSGAKISRPIADTEHGWLPNGPGGSTFANMSSDAKGQVLYNTAKAAKNAGVACLVYYAYEEDLMGNPAADPIVASWMGNTYKDWDAKWPITLPSPSPIPSPSVTPTPAVPTGFSASVTTAPQDGSTLTGIVPLRIDGSGIVNAELVSGSAYTPQYGAFTVSSNGTFATLNLDTTVLSNGQYNMRILAWNVVAGASNGQEITAMAPRTWTMSNGASPTPSPTPTSIGPYGQDASKFSLSFSSEFNSGTSPDSNWSTDIWYKSNNATVNYDVNNGNLRIWPALDGSSNFFDRTLVTDGHFSQKYGYFEMEAQLPVGGGLHPVFSICATNGPEIAIMHAYTGDPNGGWSTSSYHANDYVVVASMLPGDQYFADYRYKDYKTDHPDLSAGFHKFGMYWDSQYIKYYLDGVQWGPTVANQINVPMYFYVGLWMTTNGTTASTGITPTGSGNSFKINYIRSWTLGGQAPSTIVVDYYGDSTIYGINGNVGTGQVAQPAPAVFATQTGYTTHNEGVPGSTSSQLLNGADGIHPSWDNQMAKTTATHVIINHAIDDWQLDQTGYKANLQQLITIARNHGKKPILETPNPTFQTLSGGSPASDQELANKAQYMREVGFTMNVGIIDQFQMLTDYMNSNGLTAKDICPDGINPTQSIYTMKGQYAATRFNSLK